MNISDLIDDYLTNRLNEQEREAFEKQMASDPALKTDVDLQREIVSGLKAARMAELKAMLKKVPMATPTIYFTPLRIAAGLIGTAVLAAGLYFIIEKNGHFIRESSQPSAHRLPPPSRHSARLRRPRCI